MKKFKEILSKTSRTLIRLLKKFPITLVTIIIITLFLSISISSKINFINKVFTFGIILSIESLFTEAFLKKRVFRIIGYSISLLISFIFTQIIYCKDYTNLFTQNITRILVGYLIILILLSLYKIMKREGLKFNEYVLKLFANVFNSSITYIILNIGITLLSVIFIELILDGNYGSFIIRIQILLLGLFYIPAILNSISDLNDKEVSSFIRGLVKYVLLPLVAIGILIIYTYVIKILVLKQMPSNVIFRILAGIFVVAFPVWNMAQCLKGENGIISETSKVLPYLYMPFIFLEIYSISIRVIEFGITPTRYFGIMFIIFQIITLLLEVIKEKKDFCKIFIYTSVLILIAFITPLNYNNTSLWNQKNRLLKYIKSDTNFELLSEEAKQKASGAYKYLNEKDGKKYIPEYIKNSYLSMNLNNYYYIGKDGTEIGMYNNCRSIYFSNESNFIDVYGYSKLIEVNEYVETNINQISIEDKNHNVISNIDLQELVSKAIEIDKEDEENSVKYINDNKIIKIDDKKDLYMETLNITYNIQNNEAIEVSFMGYLLDK